METENIVREIINQRNGEAASNALHLAVGRVDAEVEGLQQTVYWLYNQELSFSHGNTQIQRYNSSKEKNHCIAKNSMLGEFLIKRQSGVYTTIKGEIKVVFHSISSYHPIRHPRIDAVNGSIEIKGHQVISFNSIFELASFLDKQLGKSKITIEQFLIDQQAAVKLGIQLTASENKLAKELSEITRLIRQTNELRQQPILDSFQEEIKRSKVYDGVLIIDGGPGTGKTITLIQRIKFLIDNTIVEYRNDLARILPEIQSYKGWVFFSPNNLLLGYLRNAMVEEGLKATDQRSKVWNSYLNNEILHNYGLVGTDKPFQLFRKVAAPSLFNNNSELLKIILTSLEEYILNYIKELITRNTSIKILDEGNKDFGIQVRAYANTITTSKELLQVVLAAEELNKKFKENYDEIKLKANENLQRASNMVLLYLSKDKEKYDRISKHIQISFNQKKDDDDEDGDDDLDFDSKNINYSSFNEAIEVRKSVRYWVRKLALNKVVSSEKIPDKHKEWTSLVEEFTSTIQLEEVGKELHFVKIISPLVQGPLSLLFDKIPTLYKRFRKELPRIFSANGMLVAAETMNEILKSEGARLHYDERNFIVLFINGLLRRIQKRNQTIFNESPHLYFQAYKDHQRFLIGIDEATDFSLIEIACMNSFNHPDYNCTTLSGDLMQRMTYEGLREWNQVIEFLETGVVKKLKISYRQSPTILKLAKAFYEDVTGTPSEVISHMPISAFEPRPEVKKLAIKSEKIRWIAKKISNIYKTYDNSVPSIAIFVANDDQARNLAELLNDCDELADNAIEVKCVTQEGTTINKSQVNIYDIKAIKGLEFEAVFFVDIDNLGISNYELLQKYIYVGISRAAFYLYVTYVSELPIGLEIFNGYIVD